MRTRTLAVKAHTERINQKVTRNFSRFYKTHSVTDSSVEIADERMFVPTILAALNISIVYLVDVTEDICRFYQTLHINPTELK